MYYVTTLKCGSFEHSFAFSTIDNRVISLLKPKLSGEALRVVQSVFLSSFRVRAKTIARAELLGAVEDVLRAIEEEGERLSFIYSTDVKNAPLASHGTGGMSGIRIPGDKVHYYSLDGGVGKCELQKYGIDATGQGYLVETIDCRDKRNLLTENTGEIRIKRRKIELTIPGLMADLKSRLNGLDCEELSLSYKETIRRP